MNRRWMLVLGLAPLAAVAAEYDAVVQYGRTAELGLAVSGIVEAVHVAPGARVRKGDVLVALEKTPFEAEVMRAEAALNRAAADRTEAARDHAQARELYERTVLSTVELENARLRASRAEAEHQAAAAHLKRARYELARSALSAPFDGRVLAVRVQPGEAVVSRLEARPLVSLAAEGEYVARALLAPVHASAIEPGQAASVTIAGQRYEGRVRAVGIESATADARYEIAVGFAAPGGVRVGQAARVALP
ncbi:efflux RND transporter periplasmic adaptor subunit [Sulfurifustis variabilis]|nr:efflux RND transporter periplasmic adaptor subunit [Sulfurifustis variabilis]